MADLQHIYQKIFLDSNLVSDGCKRADAHHVLPLTKVNIEKSCLRSVDYFFDMRGRRYLVLAVEISTMSSCENFVALGPVSCMVVVV